MGRCSQVGCPCIVQASPGPTNLTIVVGDGSNEFPYLIHTPVNRVVDAVGAQVVNPINYTPSPQPNQPGTIGLDLSAAGGNVLVVNDDGLYAPASPVDLSADPENALSFGTDGGLYTHEASWGLVDRNTSTHMVLPDNNWVPVVNFTTDKVIAGRHYSIEAEYLAWTGLNNDVWQITELQYIVPGGASNVIMSARAAVLPGALKGTRGDGTNIAGAFDCNTTGASLTFTLFARAENVNTAWDISDVIVSLHDLGATDVPTPAQVSLPMTP